MALSGLTLLYAERLFAVQRKFFRFPDPLLLFDLDMLPGLRPFDLAVDISRESVVGKVRVKLRIQFECRVSFPEISHHLQRVHERMVFGTRLQNNLEAVACRSGVLSGRRSE